MVFMPGQNTYLALKIFARRVPRLDKRDETMRSNTVDCGLHVRRDVFRKRKLEGINDIELKVVS